MIKTFDSFILERNSIIDEDVTIVIRRNDPEIQQKLEEIGYVADYVKPDRLPFLSVTNTFRKIGGKRPCYRDVAEDAPLFKLNDVIDCGDNEELFLKLARVLFNLNAHMM